MTVGSLAFVLTAGVGLVSASADAVLHSFSPGASDKSSAGPGPSARRPHTTTTAPAQRLPRRKAAPAHPNPSPNVLVEVYNNSGVPGVAARKAGILEGAGWNVVATDNWYGDIPANTVYYPPQLGPEAHKLAKVLGVARLRPSVAPMQFDRLTVIITSS